MRSLLNDELYFDTPEGFVKAGADEIISGEAMGDEPKFIARNVEKHIVITIGWKRAGTFVSLVLNPSDLAKQMDSVLKRQMSSYGYQRDAFVHWELDGKKMEGIRYHYTAEDTEMTAQSLVVKNGKNFYYLHFYYRTALADESFPIIQEIIENSGWV